MDLFTPVVREEALHPIFRRMLHGRFAPERAVLADWASGMLDRDGKFVREFQTTFESSFWELYVHASLKSLGYAPDFSVRSPDFLVLGEKGFVVESVVAAPPQNGRLTYNWDVSDIPESFEDFNAAAAIRICNSIGAKVRRYRDHYGRLPHVIGRPFVIALGAFDRPLAHFAISRPLLAALFGIYHCEEEAIALGLGSVPTHEVRGVYKENGSSVDLGLFLDERFSEVSALIYSCVATWGKVRALADDKGARTIYTSFHPNRESIYPRVITRPKEQYSEHLLDGMFVVHNPFAKVPLPEGVLQHTRIAVCKMPQAGELHFDAPDDFLLTRILMSFTSDT